MENWDLERRTDKARETIDDLVAEIETLEKENKMLQDQVESHLDTIEQLREEIDEFKNRDFRDADEN